MRVGKGPIVLTSKDRKALESWVDRPGVPLRLIIRAWIVLLSASGHSTASVASRLGVSASTVLIWRNRFVQGGLADISDEKKIKRPRHGDDEIRKILDATKKLFPPRARRWSIRNMAKFMGVSRSTVQRIWKTHGLRPYQADQFKFEHDPRFYEECRDIAGLYIESQRTYAIALIVDEAAPPPRGGLPATSAEEDPALVSRVLRAVGRGRKKIRMQKPDLLDFLKWVESHTPPKMILHLIVPRQCVTLYPQTFRWLKRHSIFQKHVIPKEISTREFIEEWLVKTSEAARTRQTFPNLPDLQRTLREFSRTGTNPPPAPKRFAMANPFLWVRPDRNYSTDERQLELDLSLA